tara:strand:+ start:1600 stop:3279 length:1680 start_codon:yes stop_codon:yes gene_type:complete
MSNFNEYMSTTDSSPVSKGPCDCGSSDGNVLFSDGHHYCFVCNSFTPSDNSSDKDFEYQPAPIQGTVNSHLTEGAWKKADLEHRNLKGDTLGKYGVSIDKDGSEVTKHYYPYSDVEGNHIANKVRQVKDKKFFVEGNLPQATLFGQNLFTKGGKYITICEGEIDAMSAYELTGSQYAVVSVKTGAAGAAKDVRAAFEYLNSFESIVICFDMDEAGQAAATKVAQLFEPNKCKVMKLDEKDANDYLKKNDRVGFTKAWWAAEVYTPAGIINLANIGDALYDEADNITVKYPWEGMNEILYGIRTGELVTFTAGTGAGKSSIIRELEHWILNHSEENIGIFSLEENTRQTCFHLMAVEANARLNIKEVRDLYSKDALQTYQKNTIGTGRVFAFDHFGSLDNDDILNRLRYMVKALNCKWIILDHLSILVSGQEGNDERRSIDILMTKLRSLVEETQCALLMVSHIRRMGGDTGAEDGKEIALNHLRGSASIAQISDAVIAIERDQQADDPNEANRTTVRVLKNRYAGITGVACHLTYDRDTGRLTEADDDFDDPLDIPFTD